jgi:hypothetical protein
LLRNCACILHDSSQSSLETGFYKLQNIRSRVLDQASLSKYVMRIECV